MNLVISEKNIAAKRIAEILAVGKPKADKVYTTPVYEFRRDGEDWVSIGLKGHIMEVDFAPALAAEDVKALAQGDERVLRGGAGELLASEGELDLKRWRLETLPVLARVDVEKVPKEKGIIQSIKNLAKKADKVIIATDFDREGELIGADARDVVRSVNKTVPVTRVRFSAITKDELEHAFANEGALSEELAQAGETRQDIDLIWGAVLTRYLTLTLQKITKKPFGDVLSSGRVQTPTLKLICDREKEREAFVPEDYWTVRGTFSHAGDEFVAPHETKRFDSEDAARAVLDAVSSAQSGTVSSVTRTKRQSAPPAPFNTTALMAAAASEGMSPSQTMRVAESLYMSGLISYPRVDNTVYPPSLDIKGLLRTLTEVPVYREHANKLLAKGTLTATRGSKEATDHPPIHPTGVGDPDKLEPQAWKLYNLVARRFMATLSDPALIEGTTVALDVAGQAFIAKGDVVVVPGYRAIYPYGLRKDEHLPQLAEGESVGFLGAELEAKQTQPPARFSQGKLIQEMERLGLGTKATRHDIIQTLFDRKYIANDPVEPTFKGRSVIDALSAYASEITTPEMTVKLDREMDEIANGRSTLPVVLGHSQNALATVVDELLPRAAEVAELLKDAIDEDAKVGKCPVSGHDLLIKYSPRNRSYFVGCTGYPECTVTYPLPKNAKYQASDEPCPVCGTPQIKVIQFRKRPRLMCLSAECPTKRGPEIVIAKGACPTGDGGDLVVQYSAVGSRYVRCTNYENCKTSFPLPQSGDIEPTDEKCDCGTPKVTVHTSKGPWTICIDPECPLKPERPARNGRYGARNGRGGKAAGGAKKAGAAKSGATARKAAAKKATPKKATATGKSATAKKNASSADAGGSADEQA